MADDFFSDTQTGKTAKPKHVFRLYRRLFLLVFAVAVLWQGLLLVDRRFEQYYQELNNSFKVLLTLPLATGSDTLLQLKEQLGQQKEVAAVQVFSSQEAIAKIRRQNPQLAQSLLLMGREQMPPYLEVQLQPFAAKNIESLVVNWQQHFPQAAAHYNAQQAQLVFATGLCIKLLRAAMSFAALLFFIFMFMVEAYPSGTGRSHAGSAFLAGLLAGGCAGLLFVGLVYPTGFLSEAIQLFTTVYRQILLLVFCGLFGWTLSKWQKF